MVRKCFFAKIFIALIIILSSAAYGYARPINVGVWNSPPYVITDDPKNINGLSVHVWKMVAKEAGLDYRLKIFKDLPSLLKALKENRIDASIGVHVASSEKAEDLFFTQPYYLCFVGVMTRKEALTLWERVKPFLSIGFITAIISLSINLLFVGYLFWFFERKSNPQFQQASATRGLGMGMWLALSTLTTVGFGDIVPKTRGGRVICALWMIISLAMAATFTAGLSSVITTTFTTEYISSAKVETSSQLIGKKIIVLPGTNIDKLLISYGGNLIYQDNLHIAVKKLLDREVDAIVFDKLALMYYLQSHSNQKLMISPISFHMNYLSFAFSPKRYNIFHKFNICLLRLRENRVLENVESIWLQTINCGEKKSVTF